MGLGPGFLGCLQNNESFNNSEIFSYEKMHKTLLILHLIF